MDSSNSRRLVYRAPYLCDPFMLYGEAIICDSLSVIGNNFENVDHRIDIYEVPNEGECIYDVEDSYYTRTNICDIKDITGYVVLADPSLLRINPVLVVLIDTEELDISSAINMCEHNGVKYIIIPKLENLVMSLFDCWARLFDLSDDYNSVILTHDNEILQHINDIYNCFGDGYTDNEIISILCSIYIYLDTSS